MLISIHNLKPKRKTTIMDARDIVAPAAAVTIAATSLTAPASACHDSSLNQPSTWGSSCVKTDMTGEVMTYTVPTDASKVVVKGGTENKVYEHVAAGTTVQAATNPKSGKPYAISHVIVCKDSVPVTPTPVDHPTVPQSSGAGGGQVSGISTTTPGSQTVNPIVAPTVVAGARTQKAPETIASTGESVAATAAKAAGIGGIVYGLMRLFRRDG